MGTSKDRKKSDIVEKDYLQVLLWHEDWAKDLESVFVCVPRAERSQEEVNSKFLKSRATPRFSNPAFVLLDAFGDVSTGKNPSRHAFSDRNKYHC